MYRSRSVRLGWYIKTKMLFICIHCEMALAYCILTYIELVVVYFFVINHGNWVWDGCFELVTLFKAVTTVCLNGTKTSAKVISCFSHFIVSTVPACLLFEIIGLTSVNIHDWYATHYM